MLQRTVNSLAGARRKTPVMYFSLQHSYYINWAIPASFHTKYLQIFYRHKASDLFKDKGFVFSDYNTLKDIFENVVQTRVH
jgi:hypothetical protein